MRTYNNELSIHRGESFTMTKILQNKDGSPYIVSNQLKNPYFLLTISSSKYQQANRYVKNYWLDLKDFPKFLSTTAKNIRDFDTTFEAPLTVTTTTVNGKEVTYLFQQRVGDKDVYVQPDDYVYYDTVNGKKVYKYWNDGWKDYECKIAKTFLHEDTNELAGQSYVYSIKLVCGQSMSDYLDSICKECKEQFAELTNKGKYEKLIAHGHTFPDGFNIDRALATIDISVPILAPTKLSVLSSIEGGIYG